ncbi:MAG: S8 family serine peptidase, partial [Casimicrobiaceae bacterium]
MAGTRNVQGDTDRRSCAHAASRLACAVLRWLVTAVFGASLAALAVPVLAAETVVDTITVKWRDSVLAGAASIPASTRTAMFSALQTEVSDVARTRDGGFVYRFVTPFPLDQARAAINRLRLDPNVLYARVNEPPSARVARLDTPAKADPQAPSVRRMIVKFKDAAVSGGAQRNEPLPQVLLDRLAVLLGQPVTRERAMSGGAFVVRLFQILPPGQARLLARLLESDPTIEIAEPDALRFPVMVPNDPLYGSQWHYQSPPAEVGGINLPPAWDLTTGSTSIVVSVIDTGVLPGHPDLTGRFAPGYDFIGDPLVANDGDGRDADASDPGDWITSAENASGYFKGCGASNSSFHGTHVAGTIGAATNNGAGVAGVNPVSAILPARVLGKCGGYISDIADAIRWSVGIPVPGIPNNPNPARVLNLSMGGYACDANGQNCGCDATSQAAINDALATNAVVVVAAGNSNRPAVESAPGNCNGVITVGATGRAGQRASYSNYGALVEISAPGGADGQYVLSTLNNGTTSPNPNGYVYAGYQGTSMATPHVAGVASLMLSVNPSLTPSQLIAKVQSTARTFPTGTARDCTTALCGAGIIDAGAAVMAALPGAVASTTSLATSGSPAPAGSSVTFTATVTGAAPTGAVNFSESGSSLPGCSAVTVIGTGNSRTASCTISSLAVGVHSIRADYGGDAGNLPSSSSALSQVINANATSTALASSSNPAVVGANVTFTATVTGAAPTGNVSFSDGPNAIANCATVPITGSGNSRAAACSTNALAVGTHSIVANYSGDSTNAGSVSAALAQSITPATVSTVWVDDAVPAGATQVGDGGGWNWVSSNPAPYAGSLAHQSALASGTHQHYFYNATTTLNIATGDTLFAYVYLDPTNPPSEVMLQWNDGTWEHRAYWGANLLPWGIDGSISRRAMGPLPPTGQWVRLEVPAAQVGLEGRTLNGMAFTLYNGRATWDYAGKASPPPLPTFQLSGTVTLSGGGALANVNFTASGATCTTSNAAGSYTCTVPQGWSGTITPALSGYSFNPLSASYSNVTASVSGQNYAASVLPTYQVSGTVTLSGGGALANVGFTASGASCTTSNAAGSYACTVPQGWSGSITPAASGYSFNPPSRAYSNVTASQSAQDFTAVVFTATIWVDDAVPAGATQVGDGGGWNWVSSNPAPYAGSLAHQSALASGTHQHYFYNATTTLNIATGDTLFAYVYLDPTNPPSEVMLQWNDGTWEHRAYWGANLLPWGIDGSISRRAMGPLPPTGQWVRLEVPAAQVGLEGRTLNGMAFTLYNGRATWDYAGKASPPPLPTFQLSGTVTLSGGGALANVNFTASGATCTTSNAAGSYTCTVPQGWSGTITPALSGYSFNPLSASYSNVTASVSGQNYAASVLPTYQVSGTVTLSGGGALANVGFTASGASCTTSNAAGSFACTVPQGWSGSITPAASGYSFNPPSRAYSNVTASQSAQDFIAVVFTATVWVDDAVPAGATQVGDG